MNVRTRSAAALAAIGVVAAVAFTIDDDPIEVLRSDLPALAERCTGLGRPTSAVWHARPVGNMGGLGPVDHTLEAVVVLASPDMMEMRARHVWMAAPAPLVDGPLQGRLPAGPWLLAGAGARPCAGYTGPVYVQADGPGVYLNVAT